MVTIIDYGVGNLFSLRSSLNAIGEKAAVSGDPEVISRAEKLIMPGVGAFADAAEKLWKSGLAEPIRRAADAGTPILGICLGMQLLFEKSFEFGEHDGLGLIPGQIRPIGERIPQGLKIPHMGWNALQFCGNDRRLFSRIKDGDNVYFVHSYSAVGCDGSVIALTDYGAPLTAAVAKGSVFGCQFHPEKSGTVGLNILKAFCEMR